jgi:hypothetical protein
MMDHEANLDWLKSEIMVSVAGPIAERNTSREMTLERVVAIHEAGHVVAQFLLGKRLRGASIIPWPGHSLGRAASRKPTPEDFKRSHPTDEKMAKDYAYLGDFDLSEIEAATGQLLIDHWPLVRRLADVLLERKVMSGRCARSLLHKAQRKQLRRARVVAEKDRRNQLVWDAEMRRAVSQGAGQMIAA